MKRYYVTATVRLDIRADEKIDIQEMLDEMGYEFISNTDTAEIMEEEVMDFQIKAVK